MIVSQYGIFENQDQWHLAQVLKYLDAARDRLSQPDPDFAHVVSDLRLGIEFALMLVAVEQLQKRSTRRQV